MRALLCSAILLAACAGEKTPAPAPDANADAGVTATTDAAAATSTPTRPAQKVALADLAGTWIMEGRPLDRDTVVATATMIGTGNPLTFTENFPGADPVPLHVTVAGDSVVITNGPFASDMRPGVMVSTDAVYRMHGSRLVGLLNAHYAGDTTADSLLRLRVTMTRDD